MIFWFEESDSDGAVGDWSGEVSITFPDSFTIDLKIL